MLISYLLSQTSTSIHTAHTHGRELKKKKKLESKQLFFFFGVSDRVRDEESGGGGAMESKDEQHSKDGEERISPHRLTKSPTCFERGKRGCFISISLSVYDTSRKGRAY